jgi:proline dehydrogenase
MQDQPISFNNTEVAFQARSDKELKQAYFLFKMLSYSWLVNISAPFVKFAINAKLPVKGLIRSTIYHHFCGGETITDCQETILKLGKYHIGTILDYSVEGKESEEDFETALMATLSTIERAKGDKHIPFCVFKPSGFVRFALLEKKNSGQKLSASEEKEFEEFRNRVSKMCQKAYDNKVPIYIDAEESWTQGVIDELVREMMMKYNREDIFVYNTLQMYRTDRVAYLEESITHAKANNYKTGFKIVRGAYMEKERKRAAELNIPSPIQPDKAATDRDYDKAINICFDNIDNVAICCGTHNEQSCHNLIRLMKEKKFPKDHRHIWFSQLYGMSDHISYNLSMHGYNVTKYVPYGAIEGVLPYLIRRAQENTSVAGQTSRELTLINKEIDRRAALKK